MADPMDISSEDEHRTSPSTLLSSATASSTTASSSESTGSPSSPVAQDARETQRQKAVALRARVQRYFRTLTSTYGVDNTTAAVLAVQLAKNPREPTSSEYEVAVAASHHYNTEDPSGPTSSPAASASFSRSTTSSAAAAAAASSSFSSTVASPSRGTVAAGDSSTPESIARQPTASVTACTAGASSDVFTSSDQNQSQNHNQNDRTTSDSSATPTARSKSRSPSPSARRAAEANAPPAKKRSSPSSTLLAVDHVEYEDLKRLVDECTERNDFVPLVRRVGDIFGSYEKLNASFSLPREQSASPLIAAMDLTSDDDDQVSAVSSSSLGASSSATDSSLGASSSATDSSLSASLSSSLSSSSSTPSSSSSSSSSPSTTHSATMATEEPSASSSAAPSAASSVSTSSSSASSSSTSAFSSSSSSSSSSSFSSTVKQPTAAEPTELDTIDLKAARDSFALLLSCGNEAVTNSLVNGLTRLCSNLQYESYRLRTPAELRIFPILFQNPMLQDPTCERIVIVPLLHCVSQVPSEGKHHLRTFFSLCPADILHGHVIALQQFLTLHIMTSESHQPLQKDEAVVYATRVLEIFYNANLDAGEPISFTEFYNDAVNEGFDRKKDFIAWYEEQGDFNFFTHPFILDARNKSLLLRLESVIEQHTKSMDARRQRMVHMAMGLGGGGFPSEKLVIRVRRPNLIEDTLQQLGRVPAEDLKKELCIIFVGEEAIDQGGVSKEWFQLLIREIFDPKYGMWIYDEKSRRYWFNHLSTDWIEFELIGKLLGLAIYNGVILDVHFPRVVYKKLRDSPVVFEDLKDLDPEMARGLQQLLDFEGDVEEVFGRTFSVAYQRFGEVCEFELKPGGSHIPLTQENKHEYVQLYTDYLLNVSIERQFKYFEQGFHTVCNTPGMNMLFRPEELEALIIGSEELDFKALEAITKYQGFDKDDAIIRDFWDVVHNELTDAERKRLLFFATGSDRSPIGGLGNLNFHIAKQGGELDQLPTSHTCFNVLMLPPYTSREALLSRLRTAINNAEGFGMI